MPERSLKAVTHDDVGGTGGDRHGGLHHDRAGAAAAVGIRENNVSFGMPRLRATSLPRWSPS